MATDPLWSSVKLLLDGEGDPFYANKATGSEYTAFTLGGPGPGRFGSGFNIVYSAIQLPTSGGLYGGDFTMEMWVYYTGVPIGGYYTCLLQSQNMVIYQDRSFASYEGSIYRSPAGVIKLNEWSHVALVREGTASGNCSLYADGAKVASFSSMSSFYTGGILGGYTLTSYKLNGFLDDIRISTVARYSGDTYTVPTAPHPVG